MKILERLIRTDQPESPQLVVILGAGLALILTLAAAIVSCALWVLRKGDLGAGAVMMFASSITGLTTIAVTYRNKGDANGKETSSPQGTGPGTTTEASKEEGR